MTLMIRSACILPALCTLGACVSNETTIASSDRDAQLLEIVRANGCSITEAEATELLVPLGYTPEETQAIELLWLERGWIETVPTGTLTLTDAGCNG